MWAAAFGRRLSFPEDGELIEVICSAAMTRLMST
jgi:hypothetical protein